MSLALATGLFLKVDIIRKGGPVMVPIILCSIFALAIILERLMHLYKARSAMAKFVDDVIVALKRNRLRDALDACEQSSLPVAQILKAGIAQYGQTRQEIKEAVEEAGSFQVPFLEKNLNTLATIAHVSPLLGLLGTVTGMVQVFQIIEQRARALTPADPTVLAKGIWEALITTVAGLIVAIPTFVAYNFLVAKVQSLVVEMEMVATDAVNILTQRK